MKIIFDRARMLPFSLSVVIIALDQLVKSFIVKNWPVEGTPIWPLEEGVLIRDAFLQFWHVRNRAIAFSIGQNLPDAIRPALFIVLPVIVLIGLLWYHFKSPNFLPIQRWAIAGIVGGGLGNIIDRIFRKDGVVDYVSVKFFGIFGWARWPTFNIADASVVVCCLILLVTMIFFGKDENSKEGA